MRVRNHDRRALQRPLHRPLRRTVAVGLSAVLGLSGLSIMSLAGAQAADGDPDGGTDAPAEQPIAAAARDVSAGDLEWGLRTSYRNYIAGPIAGGEVIVSDGAVWQDGSGNAQGPFTFPNATGSLDPETGTGELAFDGQVYTWGHDYGDGPILELTISDVRLQVDGETGTLVVDAEYRPFVGTDPNADPPPVETADDLAFGTVDLSGADLTPDSDGVVTVTDAPATGVMEAMEALGWDVFYSGELPDIQLDPVSFTATLEPEPTWDPAVEVYAADGETPLGDAEVTPGDEIVVRGSGFDPGANASTRPPVPAGLPAGVYVVFGRFADAWQPSEGASSDARTVIDQRWAMTQTTLDEVDPQYQDAIREQHVELTPDGTFEATLTVGENDEVDGTYGVYTYAAGGAAPNPAHELGVPVTVAEEDPDTGPEPAEEDYLDWGVKESFRTYVEGGFAHGEITVQAPAARNDDGTFRFAEGTGSVDAATAELEFSGSVHFTAHEGALDMTVTDPSIVVDGDTGVLVADVASKGLDSGEVVEYPDVEFADLDFSGTPLTVEEDVASADGVQAVLTEDGVDAFAGFYQAGTELDPVSFTVAVETVEPPDPTVELSETENLDPYADVVTVSGADFRPGDLADGLRVGIGEVTGDGSVPELEPVVTLEPGDGDGAINDDGTFQVNLQTVDVEPGSVLAVYTAPVDGDADDVYTTSTEISFTDTRTPELTVEPTERLEVDQQVDVTGTGFAPNRKISIAITANTSTHEEYGWPAGWLAHDVVQADADGNLSRTFTVPGTVTGSGEDCTEVECFVASFSSAQAGDATPVDYRADRSQDVLVPVTFAETDPDPDPDPEPEDPEFTVSPSTVRHGDVVTFTGEHLTPGETASVAVTTEPGGASDGTLDWGVRESFRNYIQGSIANGSIEVHEPASRNDDDTFRFADGTGTAGDGSAELQFSGAVYFSGHDHGDGPLLELTVNDPRIQVDGDSGVLIADVTSRSLDSGELVDYPDVEFAALDLSDAPLTISDGTVSATDVPATLTAGGVPAFADFYEAGAELDPVSFEASISESQQVEIGQETVGDDGRVELTWTVPADFQTGTATAVLTAGDVELAREFTVEAAGTGDDDGNDGGTENGTDGGAGDGTETGDDSGSDGTETGDDSGSDGTDSGDGTDGGTEVGADNGTEDGNLPNTGGSGSAALLVAGLLLALGGTAVAVMSRRRVTI